MGLALISVPFLTYGVTLMLAVHWMSAIWMILTVHSCVLNQMYKSAQKVSYGSVILVWSLTHARPMLVCPKL